MTTAEDCSCTDPTEPSNVTSLCTDDATSAVNFDTNVLCSEAVNKANDANEERKDTNCKCPPDTSSVASYCVAAATVPTKPDRQSEKSKGQPSMITTPIQPSVPCLCRSHKINGYILPVKLKEDKMQSRRFWSRLSWKRSVNRHCSKEDKMYEVCLKQTQCPRYAKARVRGAQEQHLGVPCDLQSYVCCKIAEGMSNKSGKFYDLPDKSELPKYPAEMRPKREKITEKIEIYYFDHGNSAYYRTTDCHPVLVTDKCAEKTDQAATRFWAEIFGTIHIGTAFVTAFILQLLRFVLYSVIRPLTVGIVQLIADYLVKPLLSIMFNALIQPVLILFYNIATSLRDVCRLIAEAMGLFLREIANLCATIRIVEIKHVHAPTACT